MLLAKQFFYDNFTASEICGMFTIEHLICFLLFMITSIIAVWLSRKMSDKTYKKLHWIIAISITIMEIIKIALRVYKQQGPDSWIPLYFCSLFIFAIWLSLCKNEFLKKMGYTYICFGGIAAALLFNAYPSTSLALFPIWHPASIHSFVYHWIMFYFGLLTLIKKAYAPNIKDALNYFTFVFSLCVVSYIVNLFLGTNCMFLNHAFKLPILDFIVNFSKPLYALLATIAQSLLLFYLSYFIYKLIYKLVTKKENN